MFEKQLRSLKRRFHLAFPKKRVRRNDIEFDLDCRELVDYSIFLGGWERDTLDFIDSHVKPGFITVEAGANVGAHTLLIARQSGPDGVVHAIEPTQFARTKLLRNLGLNPEIEKRVHVHDFLISDRIEENPRREIRSSWPAKAKMTWNPKETVSSPVTTIDDLVAGQGLPRVDLIKIDIDGYDLRALRGAARTIERFGPLIFVELSQNALERVGDSVAGIIEYLAGLGYAGFDTNGMIPLTTGNVIGRIGTRDSINGVFFPPGKEQPAS